MKIDLRGNNLIVFLNKSNVSDIDFFNRSELEDYFRKLFLKFNNDYDINMNGSYNIDVYIDDSYGIVLEIVKEDVEYFDYCDVVDMKITVSKYKNFLYKLNGYLNNFDNCDLYLYDGFFYISPHNIDFYSLGILIENSEIIYGKKCFDIMSKSKIIKCSDICCLERV